MIHMHTYYDIGESGKLKCLYPEAIGVDLEREGMCECVRGIPALRTTIFHAKVMFCSPLNSFEVHPGTLVIIPRDIQTSYGKADGVWTHSWLRLGGTNAGDFPEKFNLPMLTPIHLKDVASCISKLWMLHNEMQNPLGPEDKIIESMIEIWGNELSRQYRGKPTSPLPRSINVAKSYIQSNFHYQISLEDISEAANVSRQHLCDIFGKHVGETPISYCISLRLRMAKELLSTTDMSVAEIALESGFNNTYYFSRLFKRKTGITPSGYRQSSRDT